MSNYIPTYVKKRLRLDRLEKDLRRLIERRASEDDLLKAALAIRDARIRVIRAKQASNPEKTPEERAIFLEDRERIKQIEKVTPEAILLEYCPNRVPNQKSN
jgi:hypothetical protein